MDLSSTPEFADLTEGEKILVRSNGTVTYVGKDIAYQLWKFGLLGSDFHYRPFHTYPGGHVLWTTAVTGEEEHPPFGGGETIYNVIDVRQSYLQRIVVESLRLLGHPEEAGRSIHFSYEMVALSPRCAAEMGIPVGEEEASRSFLEMSGRKGVGVKADDLVDNLVRKAEEEVTVRNPSLDPGRRREVALTIAVGALRYYMLRFTRNKIIAFDFADALSFDGETGPYVQYAVVRSAGILGKVTAAEKVPEAGLADRAAGADLAFLSARPLRRGVGAPVAAGAAPRDPGAGRLQPGAVGAGEVCVRPGPEVQRLLPQVSRAAGDRSGSKVGPGPPDLPLPGEDDPASGSHGDSHPSPHVGDAPTLCYHSG